MKYNHSIATLLVLKPRLILSQRYAVLVLIATAWIPLVPVTQPFIFQYVKVMNFIATIASTDMISFTQTRTLTITLNLDEFTAIPTLGWLKQKVHVHRAVLDGFVRQKAGVFWTNLCITVHVGFNATVVFAGLKCRTWERYCYRFHSINRIYNLCLWPTYNILFLFE